ncbi:MAG: MotA/TolQ/ExbB proton channel family protein [Planctomycetaceae bacterium]|nr:MAG: MotA/TolQ/ExbB proton channel family protein [Planctomycetaceae bacterium]
MQQCNESGPWTLARFSVLAVIFALVGLLTVFAAGPMAIAQDEDVPAEAPAAPPPPTPTPTDEAPREMSYLAWVYEALGPGYMIVFLGLSFTLVALFVMNLLTARRENVCPQHLLESFEAHLNEQHYQEAYELAKADESMLGMVLSAGLAKLSMGYPQALEAMQEVGEDENMKLEHRLSYLALIGTISPMVGLFGTVHGMIASFQVIAAGGSTPKASDLAQGISTALFTTLIGLAIAIPAIAAFNILRNRVARLVLEVGICSEDMMSRFQNVGGQK